MGALTREPITTPLTRLALTDLRKHVCPQKEAGLASGLFREIPWGWLAGTLVSASCTCLGARGPDTGDQKEPAGTLVPKGGCFPPQASFLLLFMEKDTAWYPRAPPRGWTGSFCFICKDVSWHCNHGSLQDGPPGKAGPQARCLCVQASLQKQAL